MVMKGVVYCNRGCGAHNPHGVRKCQTCGMEMDTPRTNPITSAEFANRKMAVFDIDDTILDVGQRFKDAVRGGFQNKDGSIPKGKVKQRQEFLYREEILMKDRVIPGAKALIDYLMERGYAIAYCTARPFAVYEATLDQLEAKGFPIFDNPNGEPLLYCKKALGLKKPVYKSRVVAELQAQYDVRLFFDNRIETCAAIAQIDVPGVYTSINDYWKLIQGDVRDNPSVGMHKGQQFVTHPHAGVASRMMIDPDDPDGRTVAETSNIDVYTGQPKNPGFYSKDMLERAFESIKGTKIQTNPGPNMEMCGTCVYMCEKSGMCKKWSKMKGSKVYVLADWYCGAYKGRSMSNPPIKPRRKKMKNGKYRKEPAKSYIQRFMGDKKMNKEFPDDAQRYAVGINYVDKIYGKGGLKSIGVKMNPGHAMTVKDILIDEGGASGLKPLMKAFPKGTTKAQAKKLLKEVPDVYLHPAGDYILMNPGEKYSSDYMVPRDVDKLHKAGESINDTYYEGLEVPEWWKSKMSVTADQADNLADALGYVADNPRSNPPKNKIEKGKQLYKHMNGVDPQKTETKTIDMGDVWYQVGEGGCWQIGYMSGKETGSSSQKYVHHFNEETKNGDFPKLYATIPDKGKPMLIITGGTWKIKTDDQGVAWIYD